MGRILYWASAVAGVITFIMMWLIDANALSRKIFNAPVPGGVELTQSLLTVAIMLPFGYVLLKREHVNTVFLTSTFSPRVNRWLHFFWMCVGCLVFAAVTYGTFLFALRSYAMNEQVWGATIRFPLYPAKFAVSLGTALISIQFALDALVALVTGDDGDLSSADPDPEKAMLHV
jgi:TRAP-type C4-dicarboxylate transport system permease small subunit